MAAASGVGPSEEPLSTEEPRGRVTVDEHGRVVTIDEAAAAALGGDAAALVGRRLGEADDDAGIAVVSTVAHELRSPLTSIRGYSSLLRNRWERIEDVDKRMMLDQIALDAERVTRLIDELLDISRLASGRMALAPTPVDLGATARSVAKAVALTLPDLDGEVAVVGDEDGPVVASADADKVVQVLTNLLENAAKYGGAEAIRVELGRDAGEVSVTVRDRGPGIESAETARIFDRGYGGSRDRPSGTGLGLWISRGLVEAHGGRLTVESAPGRGAAFTFTLPAGD